MNGKRTPEAMREHSGAHEEPYSSVTTTDAEAPDAELPEPDANVDDIGNCLIPAYGETARADTGDPCIDGRNWPEQKNVPQATTSPTGAEPEPALPRPDATAR